MAAQMVEIHHVHQAVRNMHVLIYFCCRNNLIICVLYACSTVYIQSTVLSICIINSMSLL